MTINEWNKFIQVNIYGRTLQDLQEEGISLESFLGEIGCEKVWITEGSMYNGQKKQNKRRSSENRSNLGNLENSRNYKNFPVITSLTTAQLPRSSTPLNACLIDRKFTLNQDLSEIGEFDVDMHEIHEILHGIVDQIVEKETDSEKILKWSTTMADAPRCSTPISTSPIRKITLNMPEMLSNIGSNDSTEESSQEIEISPKILKTEHFEPFCLKWSTTMADAPRCSTPISTSPIRKITLNLPEMLSKIGSTDSTRISPKKLKKRRNSGRMSVSELKNPRKTEEFEHFRVKRSISENLVTNRREEVIRLENSGDFHGNSDNFQTIPEENLPTTAPPNFLGIKAEIFEEIHGNELGEEDRFETQNYSMDYGNYEQEDNYFSLSDSDETAVMELDEETRRHSPIDFPSNFQTKSILRSDVSRPRSSKKVSFKTKKMTKKQREENEIHRIKCNFENCSKVLVWRKRNGKQRLVDHALVHGKESCLVCQKCDHACKTSRQVAYHYKSKHPEIKGTHFNILEILNKIMEDTVVADLFDKCFGDQSAIVGTIGKTRNLRRKTKKTKEGEEENGGGEDEAGPSNGLF